MQICHTKDELRSALAELRRSGDIGLVPTMGHLHAGHMALISKAASQNVHVVASIFVNPIQFGSQDDLAHYPRTLERDLDMLRAAGVAIVFVPTSETMFHANAQTHVETTTLANILMGSLRPGHFKGVATIVMKLFNLFQPNRAYFGEKDYQQLAVIRTMVRDLDMAVEIMSVETVRDADGLAMSSRNSRLSGAGRKAAPILFQSCKLAERLAHQGATAADISNQVYQTLLQEPLADVQSVDVRTADTLEEYTGPIIVPAVILLAVRFDPVLLIDQYVIRQA